MQKDEKVRKTTDYGKIFYFKFAEGSFQFFLSFCPLAITKLNVVANFGVRANVKMQHFVEQIAQMVEQEKKREEKRSAKIKSEKVKKNFVRTLCEVYCTKV
jgi:hypothetical protein